MVASTASIVTAQSFQSRQIFCLSCTKHTKHRDKPKQQHAFSTFVHRRGPGRPQKTNLLLRSKMIYANGKERCMQSMHVTVFFQARRMSTKSYISAAVNQFVGYAQKNVMPSLKFPNLASASTQGKKKKASSNTKQLLHFSESKKLSENISHKALGKNNGFESDSDKENLSEKDGNSLAAEDKVERLHSFDIDTVYESSAEKNSDPGSGSQYDLIVNKVPEEETPKETIAEAETEDKTMFSSVKYAVEIPVNSFFSFFSQSSLFKKSETPVSDAEEIASLHPEDKQKPEEQITSAPKSLLENLYQFIPYMFSNATQPQSIRQQTKELDDARKEAMRVQNEKDKIAQKVEVNNRTRYLIQSIRDANSLSTLSHQVDDLKNHLLRFPDTRITAVKENAVREITHVYRTTMDKDILPSLRMTLALLGAVDPPKQKGIRVLCIDGGGCRGILAVEIFRRMTELSGKPIHEMFDYICGVSTGAIIAFLLGIKKISISDVEQVYRNLGSEVFNQNRLVGTGNLVLSHAYYNTETLQKILKTVFGDRLLIETAADEDVPKCSAVSTLANRLVLKPYLWRNYSIVPGTRLTHWPGTCRGRMWEALRASSAAPGYFEEFKKHQNIHQDGGLLTNNPTGVALNECSLLWPNAPIQCVVSVGTGRYEPTVGPTNHDFLGLKDKLLKVVDSATSVSEVHTVMYDLLPGGTYYRFNPFMREQLQLDDFEESKLNILVEDAKEYIALNDYKFRACIRTLTGGNVASKL